MKTATPNFGKFLAVVKGVERWKIGFGTLECLQVERVKGCTRIARGSSLGLKVRSPVGWGRIQCWMVWAGEIL
jgi:hypothetical protein